VVNAIKRAVKKKIKDNDRFYDSESGKMIYQGSLTQHEIRIPPEDEDIETSIFPLLNKVKKMGKIKSHCPYRLSKKYPVYC